MSQENITATQEIFVQFGAGNIPGILALLDDDIVIEFYGPNTIPYAGTYHGKDEAQQFFETVLTSVDINQFDPEEMLAAEDKVFVTGAPQSKRQVYRWCDRLRFRARHHLEKRQVVTLSRFHEHSRSRKRL